MSLVYYITFSLSNRHKDVIVNLSGRTLMASIWTLNTAHFIMRCRGWRGWAAGGGVDHHSSDRCGPVTTQLIKARHSDSYVTLSISLSLCVSLFLSERSWTLGWSHSRAEGPTIPRFKAWTRAALACLHKKPSLSSPRTVAAQHAAQPSSQAREDSFRPRP